MALMRFFRYNGRSIDAWWCLDFLLWCVASWPALSHFNPCRNSTIVINDVSITIRVQSILGGKKTYASQMTLLYVRYVRFCVCLSTFFIPSTIVGTWVRQKKTNDKGKEWEWPCGNCTRFSTTNVSTKLANEIEGNSKGIFRYFDICLRELMFAPSL